MLVNLTQLDTTAKDMFKKFMGRATDKRNKHREVVAWLDLENT